MLRPGFALAREQLLDAGVVIREGIDAGETPRHEFALQPHAFLTLHHEDLSQRMAMTIDAPAAITEINLGARGQLRQRRLGIIHQRPGPIAAPAKRRCRRLGPDQPHHGAIGQGEGVAAIDVGDRAPLGLG